MNYTPELFGEVLKRKIAERNSIEAIANWAYDVQIYICKDRNDWFYDLVLTMEMMGIGEEFEYTYEELEKIANDLIAGKEVKLG